MAPVVGKYKGLSISKSSYGTVGKHYNAMVLVDLRWVQL